MTPDRPHLRWTCAACGRTRSEVRDMVVTGWRVLCGECWAASLPPAPPPAGGPGLQPAGTRGEP